VKIASMVEMFSEPPSVTSKASLAQVSDQSPPTFKESLLAASKAPSGAGAAYQAGPSTGRRQKPVSADPKLPPTLPLILTAVPPPRSQELAPQRVLVTQQPHLINPALIAMPLPFGAAGVSLMASAVPAGLPKRDGAAVGSLSIESNISQPAVAKSDSVPSSHVQKESDPSQAASILPPVSLVLQDAANLSNTVANMVSNTLSSTPPHPVSNAAPNEDASAVANAIPGVLPDVVQKAVPNLVSSDAPNAVPSVSNAIQKPIPGAISGRVSASPSFGQNSASPVVPSGIPDASSNAASKGDVAPQSNSVSTSEVDPPTATPDPGGLATGLGVPGVTADQLVALIQPNGGLLLSALASTSGATPAMVAKPSVAAVANGKDGASAINDATGLKQHAPASSDQTGSQTGSQGTAPFGDQSQGGASQQGQSAAPAQMNLANHTIAALDHAQSAGLAAPPQTAPALAGANGHSAKTPDVAASATLALPQAVPVINTAKLIQSMGQSEMRVGMRSDDFGNISISTSATRDLISAQISLEHGELARTLAVHLPEMQARFGGNQAMDVRIDMNGQATGQSAGTSPGMSNGSHDGSRGDRQQKGSASSSQSAGGFAGPGSAIAAAGLPSGETDARLDIRA
jgi:hypothetical protein